MKPRTVDDWLELTVWMVFVVVVPVLLILVTAKF